MTRCGGSPAANRRSASTRRRGHEYEPGRPRRTPAVTRRMCAASAARWRLFKHPAVCHKPVRHSTRSRPPRRHRNLSLRWVSHSQTDTPWVRWCSAAGPFRVEAQTAHAGCSPVHRSPPRPLAAMTRILTHTPVTPLHPYVPIVCRHSLTRCNKWPPTTLPNGRFFTALLTTASRPSRPQVRAARLMAALFWTIWAVPRVAEHRGGPRIAAVMRKLGRGPKHQAQRRVEDRRATAARTATIASPRKPEIECRPQHKPPRTQRATYRTVGLSAPADPLPIRLLATTQVLHRPR